MSKVVLRGWAAVLVLTSVIAVMAAAAFIRGFVIYKMWNWFIVPLGAVEIGILHAYGLSLMVGIVFAFAVQNEDKKKNAAVSILELLMNNALVLLFGWFVHLLM
jgi:uncharacterized membrane protein